MLKRKFSMFDDTSMEPGDRLHEIQKSKKELPSVHRFGDGVEHRTPIAKCVYCGQAMFEIKLKANGDSIASCPTPDCLGNQNTKVDPYWFSLKKKMDDRICVRNGVWTK